MRKWALSGLSLSILLPLCAQIFVAQTPKAGKTVWDAVYSSEQAARGKGLYETNCSDCHSADLAGGEGRPLRGDVFVRDWTDKELRRLFDRAKTMPPGAAGSLADGVYVDILAYVLEVNSYPAGPKELTVDALEEVRVEGKEGPGVVPNFSPVQMVGCLSGGPDGTWTLTKATSPARTSDMEPAKEDQLKVLQSTLLGTQTFRLMYVFPSPESLLGHKVEAKGLLIRAQDENRLNVTSLQSVAPACDR